MCSRGRRVVMELRESTILVTQEKLKPIKKGKMPPQVISRRNLNIFFYFENFGTFFFFICPFFLHNKNIGIPS